MKVSHDSPPTLSTRRDAARHPYRSLQSCSDPAKLSSHVCWLGCRIQDPRDHRESEMTSLFPGPHATNVALPFFQRFHQSTVRTKEVLGPRRSKVSLRSRMSISGTRLVPTYRSSRTFRPNSRKARRPLWWEPVEAGRVRSSSSWRGFTIPWAESSSWMALISKH